MNVYEKNGSLVQKFNVFVRIEQKTMTGVCNTLECGCPTAFLNQYCTETNALISGELSCSESEESCESCGGVFCFSSNFNFFFFIGDISETISDNVIYIGDFFLILMSIEMVPKVAKGCIKFFVVLCNSSLGKILS